MPSSGHNLTNSIEHKFHKIHMGVSCRGSSGYYLKGSLQGSTTINHTETRGLQAQALNRLRDENMYT